MPHEAQGIEAEAKRLVEMLREHFSPDTALPGSKTNPPSSGHCAAAALVLHEALGGDLVSSYVQGISHWFNRLRTDDGSFDIDATADQFNEDAAWLSKDRSLYPDARVRRLDEANDETLARAVLLARRAGLPVVAEAIEQERRSRIES